MAHIYRRDTCPNIIALFGFYVFERELPDQKLLTETEEDGGEQEDTLAEDIVIELLFGHEAHDIEDDEGTIEDDAASKLTSKWSTGWSS